MRVTVPADIAGYRNGRLPLDRLAHVYPSSQYLHPYALAAFTALKAECDHATGTRLWFTGCYRTYAEQVALERRQGRASTATPGTSEHGWAVALDLALLDSRGRATVYIGGTTALGWLRTFGRLYGFAETVRNEPWHWAYTPGVPFRAPTGTAPPPADPQEADEPPTDEEENVPDIMVRLAEHDDVFAFYSTGVVRRVGPAQFAAFAQHGVPQVVAPGSEQEYQELIAASAGK